MHVSRISASCQLSPQQKPRKSAAFPVSSPTACALRPRTRVSGLGELRDDGAAEAKQERRRIKELERDLSRKDKALAETAALLVLSKTYGPPRLQVFSAISSEQSASTYPVSGLCPDQDGDPRAPVLIKLAASSAIF